MKKLENELIVLVKFCGIVETFKSFIQKVIDGLFEFLHLVLSKIDVVGLQCVVLAYDDIINSKFFFSWLLNVLCVMIVSVFPD